MEAPPKQIGAGALESNAARTEIGKWLSELGGLLADNFEDIGESWNPIYKMRFW